MIISHKHKFIFLKTRKTAGSSIQVTLAKHCGKDDIITGQYRLGIDDNSHSAGLNMDKFYTNHPHPELTTTKRFLGNELWNSYFSFAIIRNPYDIAVSRYHWDIKGKKGLKETSIEGFKSWVKEGNLLPEDCLHRYTCLNDGTLNVDFIGRYENLEEDLNYICNKIGIPNLELPTLKGGFREKTHYSEFYDAETIQIVRDFFKRDIEIFNYKFEFRKDFKLSTPTSIINQNIINDNNINGPSLIKVPNYVKNKLGKYYLYFANHKGKTIRMAYSDNLEGLWTLYRAGTLQLNETPCNGHIASPDVHVIDDKIVMYYHGDLGEPYNGQYTFKAESLDGIKFTSDDKVLTPFYHREFNYLGSTYAICKNKNINSQIYKRVGSEYKLQFELLDNSRHTAVHIDGNKLYIFYTIVGEAPERIYVLKIVDWEILSNYELKRPELQFEGAMQPNIPSRFGMALGFSNELRDPCIFDDGNHNWLLYAYGGESGIAIEKLEKL